MLQTPPPKGDRYYGRVASNYNKKRKKQAWWHVEHEEMRGLLERLPRGLSVVDIPFGTGRFVPLYRERGFRISGLEISSEMLDAAQDDLGALFDGVDARVGSAMETPYADAAFDLVVSTRFLSNIVTYADARRALAEFSRITAKYGILQLGHTVGAPAAPEPGKTMDMIMSEAATDALLEEFRFRPVERRLVMEMPDIQGRMCHILCEKF